MKPYIIAVTILMHIVLLTGCENGEQKSLYLKASELEQVQTGVTFYEKVEAYRKVVRLDPISKLGKQAQERIDSIELIQLQRVQSINSMNNR